MPYRLPASGQISFLQLAQNGGNTSAEMVTMNSLHTAYNVDTSDPDSINEFYGKCACYQYGISNFDFNYSAYLSYQNCDGIWSYNEDIGPGMSIIIHAILGTVSFSQQVYNEGESAFCDE